MNRYLKYLTGKLKWYILTFFIAVFLNFFLPRFIPGNPVSALVAQMAGGGASSDVLDKLYNSYIQEFGLDKPWYTQFINYVLKVFHGDLGISFSLYPTKVNTILSHALPWTIALQAPAILIGWIIGNLLGALAAYKKGKFDSAFFPLALFINSIPYYCLAIILLYLFGVLLDVFPIGGGYSMQLIPSFSITFLIDALKHYLLPFFSLILVTIGGQAIGMREMSIYELNTDYVRYAKLLGISEKKITRYVFKNAMLPQITGLAISLGTMVGGALITEIVFSYPGIGTWLFNGIRQQDYPLIQGGTLVITMAVLLANFLIDIVYGIVDPRIRMAQMEE
ncbi:MAG: ABC transporter permease [Thermotoga sp.]|nr:ABC transporter permease [Thermotogota bacterium]RKX53213.1 MAG: ABC transporter permease [Thermotoga sp.]